MIFAIQSFLEDSFTRRGFRDTDNYPARVAEIFERFGQERSPEKIALQFGKIRTAFFRNNSQLRRGQFEIDTAKTLRSKFPFLLGTNDSRALARATSIARSVFRAKRRSILTLLAEFKKAVQSRGIDAYWDSRKKARLRKRPEKVAQAALGVFARGALGRYGSVFREVGSGIGFVDLVISFGHVYHLVELKVLTGKFVGPDQLAAYMETEGRETGWLVVFDARSAAKKTALPEKIMVKAGIVNIVVIDINPTAPHRSKS
jgi:hypothetical protein